MSAEVRFGLNEPQGKFLAMDAKFRAFVAGFGSGKTFVGSAGMCAHFWQHPKVNQGYFAPTYPHIRDIFYPTIEEVAAGMGLNVKIKTGDKEVDFYSGRVYRGTTICRSMDRPASIVGFKIGHGMVDELDVLPRDKAALAWRKIIARLRWKDDAVKNGVDVTTTPEGFNFVHHQFVSELAKKPELGRFYGLVQASTYDNEANLPDDYIPSLISSYPEALIAAYLDGQFVNLTAGSVYPSFNRMTSFTNGTIQPGEALHIGMDFNVTKMAAVVHVLRDGRPYALDEIVDAYDTPQMLGIIAQRYPGRTVMVYPDASGKNRKSANASETDHALIRAAGYTLCTNPSNPGVRDRVLSVNRAFEDGYWVNPDRCPRYVEGLERQAYDKNGEPDKSQGFDHVTDAGGYFVAYRFPILHNRVVRVTLGGR